MNETITTNEARDRTIQKLAAIFKDLSRTPNPNRDTVRPVLMGIAEEFLELYNQEKWSDLLTVDELKEIFAMNPEELQGSGAFDAKFMPRFQNFTHLISILRYSRNESIHEFYTRDLIEGVGNKIAELAKKSGKEKFIVLEV